MAKLVFVRFYLIRTWRWVAVVLFLFGGALLFSAEDSGSTAKQTLPEFLGVKPQQKYLLVAMLADFCPERWNEAVCKAVARVRASRRLSDLQVRIILNNTGRPHRKGSYSAEARKRLSDLAGIEIEEFSLTSEQTGRFINHLAAPGFWLFEPDGTLCREFDGWDKRAFGSLVEVALPRASQEKIDEAERRILALRAKPSSGDMFGSRYAAQRAAERELEELLMQGNFEPFLVGLDLALPPQGKRQALGRLAWRLSDKEITAEQYAAERTRIQSKPDDQWDFEEP